MRPCHSLIRLDASRLLANEIWSVVHGIARLAIDGIVTSPADVEQLTRFAQQRMWSGLTQETS